MLSGTHDANDIYINSLDWYERNNINLSAGVRAIGIDRQPKTVYESGGHLVPYDKLVLATRSLSAMPPIGGLHSDDGALLPVIFAFRALDNCGQMINHAANVKRAAISAAEEVSRAFGGPKVFLSEYDDATLSNISVTEQFCYGTPFPELWLLEEGFNRELIGGHEMGVKGWRSSMIIRTSKRCRSRSRRKRNG